MDLSHEAPRRSDEEGKLLTDHYVSDPVDVVKGSHSFCFGLFLCFTFAHAVSLSMTSDHSFSESSTPSGAQR